MSKHSVTTAEKIGAFELVLPAPFNAEPLWVIPVSKNYTARIYKVEVSIRRDDGTELSDKQIRVPGYRVEVRHNATGKVWQGARHYGDDFQRAEDVATYLRNLAVDLAPKVRSTVERSEED